MGIESLSEAVGSAAGVPEQSVTGVVNSNINTGNSSDKSSSNSTQNNALWLAEFDEDLRNHKSLNKFTDVKSLAKSYVELEKNFDKRVPLPANDADDESWNKFFKNVGMPEDGKYLSEDMRVQLLKSGADNETLTVYEQLFHKSGLTARQGRKLLDNLQ